MIFEGPMRHVIDIQQQSTQLDSFGQQILVWTSFIVCRAAIARVPGREVFDAAHRAGRVPVVFRIRWRAGLFPKMRVAFDGRLHNITSISDPDGLKEQLLIVTEELVGET